MIKKYTYSISVLLLISFLIFSFPASAAANNPEQMQALNQEMYSLYFSGNKEKAFNIYKETLNRQVKATAGQYANLFPETTEEYNAYQTELAKQGLHKSIDEIKDFTDKTEAVHREMFEAIMNNNPDKLGIASQNLETLTKSFLSQGSSDNQTSTNNSVENNAIYDGGIGDNTDRMIDTVETFFTSWSDYVSERDSSGNLKAFSDLHQNTPDSLVINEDDGIVMSSFKVLGKGGYYLFLKARLWIAEGYGEIGSLLGKWSSEYIDQ